MTDRIADRIDAGLENLAKLNASAARARTSRGELFTQLGATLSNIEVAIAVRKPEPDRLALALALASAGCAR
jgi:hypothetical protein